VAHTLLMVTNSVRTITGGSEADMAEAVKHLIIHAALF